MYTHALPSGIGSEITVDNFKDFNLFLLPYEIIEKVIGLFKPDEHLYSDDFARFRFDDVDLPFPRIICYSSKIENDLYYRPLALMENGYELLLSLNSVCIESDTSNVHAVFSIVLRDNGGEYPAFINAIFPKDNSMILWPAIPDHPVFDQVLKHIKPALLQHMEALGCFDKNQAIFHPLLSFQGPVYANCRWFIEPIIFAITNPDLFPLPAPEKRQIVSRIGLKKKVVKTSYNTYVLYNKMTTAAVEQSSKRIKEFSHRFEVAGHWRKVKRFGHDREGNLIQGKTWVRPCIKGPQDKPLIKKTRVITP